VTQLIFEYEQEQFNFIELSVFVKYNIITGQNMINSPKSRLFSGNTKSFGSLNQRIYC